MTAARRRSRKSDGGHTHQTNIAEVIGFDGVLAAHRRMEENRYRGKVVVDLSR